MKQTKNYGLTVYEGADIPDKDDYNANNEKIDNLLFIASKHNHDGVNSEKITASNVVFDAGETTLESKDLNSAVQEVFTEADNSILWGTNIIGQTSDLKNDPQRRLYELDSEWTDLKISYINAMRDSLYFDVPGGVPGMTASLKDMAIAVEKTCIPEVTATQDEILDGVGVINKWGLHEIGNVPYVPQITLLPKHTEAINIKKSMHDKVTLTGFGVANPALHILKGKKIAGVTGTMEPDAILGWNPGDIIDQITKLQKTPYASCYYKRIKPRNIEAFAPHVCTRCPDIAPKSVSTATAKNFIDASIFVYDTNYIHVYGTRMNSIASIEVGGMSGYDTIDKNDFNNKPLIYASNRVDSLVVGQQASHKYLLLGSYQLGSTGELPKGGLTIYDMLQTSRDSYGKLQPKFQSYYSNWTVERFINMDQTIPYENKTGEWTLVVLKHNVTGVYGMVSVFYGSQTNPEGLSVSSLRVLPTGFFYAPSQDLHGRRPLGNVRFNHVEYKNPTSELETLKLVGSTSNGANPGGGIMLNYVPITDGTVEINMKCVSDVATTVKFYCNNTDVNPDSMLARSEYDWQLLKTQTFYKSDYYTKVTITGVTRDFKMEVVTDTGEINVNAVNVNLMKLSFGVNTVKKVNILKDEDYYYGGYDFRIITQVNRIESGVTTDDTYPMTIWGRTKLKTGQNDPNLLYFESTALQTLWKLDGAQDPYLYELNYNSTSLEDKNMQDLNAPWDASSNSGTGFEMNHQMNIAIPYTVASISLPGLNGEVHTSVTGSTRVYADMHNIFVQEPMLSNDVGITKKPDGTDIYLLQYRRRRLYYQNSMFFEMAESKSYKNFMYLGVYRGEKTYTAGNEEKLLGTEFSMGGLPYLVSADLAGTTLSSFYDWSQTYMRTVAADLQVLNETPSHPYTEQFVMFNCWDSYDCDVLDPATDCFYNPNKIISMRLTLSNVPNVMNYPNSESPYGDWDFGYLMPFNYVYHIIKDRDAEDGNV